MDQASPTFQKQQEMIRRLEDKSIEPPYKHLFLEIDDDVLENLEIVLGPRMNDAEKVIVRAILNQYCKKGNEDV